MNEDDAVDPVCKCCGVDLSPREAGANAGLCDDCLEDQKTTSDGARNAFDWEDEDRRAFEKSHGYS